MTARNPYPGLRSFEPADSALFFGREDETDELRRRLRQTRFLAVVGSSGSGKSSLVRCGLLPTLHAGLMSGGGDDWRVAILRPGDDPLGALAAALDQPGVLRQGDEAHATTRRTLLEAGLRDSSRGLAETVRQAALPSGTRLLVLVDQFEELFRYRQRNPTGAEGDEAGAFVQLLLEAARASAVPVYVVLTMRAEFIGDCMAFAGLAEAINSGQYLIPQMSRDAMRRAIGSPAAVSGTAITPRLMVRLLNEVGVDLDRLPVLQHALMRTWQAWAQDHAEGEAIDVRHYEAIGTTREALARHAEEAWSELTTPRARAIGERLWRALTETTEAGRGVRRPTAYAVLQAICDATPAELAPVIEAMRAPGRGMLQPPVEVPLTDTSVIDITHESLMRLWPRLAEWTRQEARSADLYRRVLRAARLHQAGEASLWRAPELTLGLRWQADNRPSAAWAGHAQDFELAIRFLQRSRRAQAWRHAAAVGAVVAMGGLLLGGMAYDARSQAEKARLQQRHLEEREEAATKLAESQQRELKALDDQLQRLLSQQAAARASTADDLALRAKLNERHDALKARVAALDQQRQVQVQDVARVREINRDLEGQISQIDQERDDLLKQSSVLRRSRHDMTAEREALASRTERLSALRLTLVRQSESLEVHSKALAARSTALLPLLREVDECARSIILAASPPVVGPPPTPVSPPAASSMRKRPPIPPDLAASDDLRRRVEALARALAAQIEQRARLQDEVIFLKNAIPLLEAQEAALAQEGRELIRVHAGLQQRHASLLVVASSARLERDQALVAVRELETAVQVARNELDGVRHRHLAVEQGAVDGGSKLDELDDHLESEQVEYDNNVQRLRSITDALTAAGGAPGTPVDLSALLAVQAYRWTPDGDGPSVPPVYSLLWRNLHRIDTAAAMGLVSAAGRTTNAALATALCQRVNRPLTQDEWRRHMPRGACYRPDAANPCDRLGPPGAGVSR